MSDGTLTILKADGSLEPVKTYTLEAHESYEDVEPQPGWRVASLSDLEWALERQGEALSIMAANAALAEEAIARIKARLTAINATHQRSADYFESQARMYAESHKAELLGKGKAKSRNLPSGSIGWRKSGGGLVVVDDAACLEWAKAQDPDTNLVRVKVELSKTALKERFKADGVVPPGCDIEPESETLTIKPVVPEVVLGTVEQKKLG